MQEGYVNNTTKQKKDANNSLLSFVYASSDLKRIQGKKYPDKIQNLQKNFQQIGQRNSNIPNQVCVLNQSNRFRDLGDIVLLPSDTQFQLNSLLQTALTLVYYPGLQNQNEPKSYERQTTINDFLKRVLLIKKKKKIMNITKYLSCTLLLSRGTMITSASNNFLSYNCLTMSQVS